MIDTHAHLDFPEFEKDLAEVLVRAREAGVAAIITIGINPDSNARAVELAERHEHIYAAVGIHPNDCAKAGEGEWAEIEALAKRPKVVGIGETGLDFYRDGSPREVQEQAFRHAIRIAAEVNQPLVIHCREAVDDCLRILEDVGRGRVRGVMHCFSGTPAQAQRFLSLGLYLSFAGQITYPNAEDLRETVKASPLERMVLETDCPFLAPQSNRGKRNEPAFVKETMEQIATLHGLPTADVDRMTSVNAYRVFSVGRMPPRGNIAYTIRNSRYVNLTNRCTNRCIFCSRKGDFYVKGYHLRLNAEPSLAEVISAIGDISKYDEVVFAGLGEPTLRLDVVVAIAKQAKRRGIKTRLNTNGHGSMINHRNICPELAGLIDRVSVNLTTTDPFMYERLCRPEHPDAHRVAMGFIEEARKTFPEVEVTSVSVPEVDVAALKAWVEARGLMLRIRTPGRGA